MGVSSAGFIANDRARSGAERPVKGAIVLTRSSLPFLAAVSEVCAELGLEERHTDDFSLQVSDPTGRLLTAFAAEVAGSEWRDAFVDAGGPGAPAVLLAGHSVECRWEDLFCQVVAALAARDEVWVVDGDGVVWQGDSLEPGKLRL